MPVTHPSLVEQVGPHPSSVEQVIPHPSLVEQVGRRLCRDPLAS